MTDDNASAIAAASAAAAVAASSAAAAATLAANQISHILEQVSQLLINDARRTAQFEAFVESNKALVAYLDKFESRMSVAETAITSMGVAEHTRAETRLAESSTRREGGKSTATWLTFAVVALGTAYGIAYGILSGIIRIGVPAGK